MKGILRRGRRDENQLKRAEDLPVVARLVVEIRSDGSTTVARGAMEQSATGETVAVEARGTTPLALAVSLVRALGDVPALARGAFRALRAGNRPPGK